MSDIDRIKLHLTGLTPHTGQAWRYPYILYSSLQDGFLTQGRLIGTTEFWGGLESYVQGRLNILDYGKKREAYSAVPRIYYMHV